MRLVHRCMIIPASLQAQCQTIPDASGMWTTGLSLDGAAPATHYISSGLVDQAFADMLTSPIALSEELGVTQEEAAIITSGILVSNEEPHSAMANIGLVMIGADYLVEVIT